MGVITVDDHYGYIDVTGKLVIPPVFVFAYLFSDSLALLSRDWIHHQYINQAGEVVIALNKGQKGRPFSEGLAPVMYDDSWGFIDKTGEWVIKRTYRKIDRFIDGVCPVKV